jgi:hypothetical protein
MVVIRLTDEQAEKLLNLTFLLCNQCCLKDEDYQIIRDVRRKIYSSASDNVADSISLLRCHK